MTFVVVYLVASGDHLVVHEDWVKGLNSAKTKNNGKNSNQDWLMFWSAVDGKPNFSIEPDFDAPIKAVFEKDCTGACYLCKTEIFEGMLLLFFLLILVLLIFIYLNFLL